MSKRHRQVLLFDSSLSCPQLTCVTTTQVFLQLDRYWDAVQCAAKAADLDPGWADAYLTLGRAQLGLREVKQFCTSLLSSAPKCNDAFLQDSTTAD